MERMHLSELPILEWAFIVAATGVPWLWAWCSYVTRSMVGRMVGSRTLASWILWPWGIATLLYADVMDMALWLWFGDLTIWREARALSSMGEFLPEWRHVIQYPGSDWLPWAMVTALPLWVTARTRLRAGRQGLDYRAHVDWIMGLDGHARWYWLTGHGNGAGAGTEA